MPGEQRRVCLLTGAAGRLGTWFASRYGADYDIVAVYRRKRPWLAAQDATFFDPLHPGADPAQLGENRHRVHAVQEDLMQPGAAERVVEAALDRFGRVDLLVNNAAWSLWAPLCGSDRLARSARAQLVTNVAVPLELTSALVRAFWQGRAAENRVENRNVVNVSSLAGMRLYGGVGQSVYAASKAALNHLTAHLADELEEAGVRANATAANTFPALVPTERAVQAIRRLDLGRETGTIVVVDSEADVAVRAAP